MMKKNICSILVLLSFCMIRLSAEEFLTLNDAEKVLQNSIDTFTNGNFQEGMDALKPYWHESTTEIDNLVVQTRNKWSYLESSYGKKIGMEKLSCSTVGESLAQFNYLVKFERYGIHFQVLLYKNNNGWSIVNFNFDDKLENLF